MLNNVFLFGKIKWVHTVPPQGYEIASHLHFGMNLDLVVDDPDHSLQLTIALLHRLDLVD